MSSMFLQDNMNEWQGESEKVLQRTSSLLKNTALSDVTFIVGPNTSSKRYVGHRVLLAMTSPVFEAMFYGDMADKSKVIRITDIAPIGFENLLRYAYTDTLKFQTVDDAMLTAYAAKKYLLPHLLRECFNYIERNVSPKNACQVYEFAIIMEAHTLVFQCLNTIDRQTYHVLTSSTFLNVSVGTLELIVRREYLNLYSEFSLYSALYLWAEEECKRRNLDPEIENLRHALENVLPYIRWLTMTSEEFCKGPAKSGLLNKEECYCVFMNLAIQGIIPMPKGLSNETNKRLSPPEYFIVVRYKPTSFHTPVRPIRAFGSHFVVTNRDIFLVGVSIPVRLDSGYYSIRQPRFDGNLRLTYKIQEEKTEREDIDVNFTLSKEKDVRLKLTKPFYLRRGLEYVMELQVRTILAEDVIVPTLRNKRKEDTVEGVTFHFHPIQKALSISNPAEAMEFAEIYFYF
ncbi:BTB/POZ domain-containing protein 3-like [Centruroides sculpturatus]|uniref:BTB/POZ domain-containing protein 3-like n=1 Tax=Centruroides sculpturatus TaxID=218467 RepID=UPI000C6DB0DD|nr:BTB/POZ domain-containing protein 3-like [Centruroides sculpturatus]